MNQILKVVIASNANKSLIDLKLKKKKKPKLVDLFSCQMRRINTLIEVMSMFVKYYHVLIYFPLFIQGKPKMFRTHGERNA